MRIRKILLISALGITLAFTGCQKNNENAKDDMEQIIKNVEIKEVEKLPDEVKVLQASRDKLKFGYPQLDDNKSEAMSKINLTLSKTAEPYIYSNAYEEIDVNPIIKRKDKDIISVVYEGKGKSKESGNINIKESVNLDAKSGENITFDTIIKQDAESLKKLNSILDKKAKENGIKEFEVEKSDIYFEDDSIVFFYMPLDGKEFVEVKVLENELKTFFR